MFRLVLSSLLCVAFALPLAASTVAYESFNYAPGAVAGQAGGAGFSGEWTPGGFNAMTVTHRVNSGSLTFPGVMSAGNSLSVQANDGISGMRRRLAERLGKDGQTVFISFLLRAEGVLGAGNSAGFFGIYLDSVRGEPDLFIGKPGAVNQWALEDRGGSGQVLTNRSVTVGATAQIVVKAEFLDGNDRFSLYVNPGVTQPTRADAVKSDIDLGLVDALVIYSGGAFSLDEIRVGTTFSDLAGSGNPAPPAQTSSAPGGIVLLPGFEHRREPGIDSLPGSISNGQLRIRYDIGASAGDYAADARNVLWSREQTVSGASVKIVMTRDRQLIVTFLRNTRGASATHPANFIATIEKEQDVADMLLMVLSYGPEAK
jgi:hypothetical protein